MLDLDGKKKLTLFWFVRGIHGERDYTSLDVSIQPPQTRPAATD